MISLCDAKEFVLYPLACVGVVAKVKYAFPVDVIFNVVTHRPLLLHHIPGRVCILQKQ